MNIEFSARAKKQLERLSPQIRKKAQKQFHLLLTDHRHPSLKTHKKAQSEQFEGRNEKDFSRRK